MFNLFKKREESYQNITFYMYRVNGRWDTYNIYRSGSGVEFVLHESSINLYYPDSIKSTGRIEDTASRATDGVTTITLGINVKPFDIWGDKYFIIEKSSQKKLKDKLIELREINNRESEKKALADLGVN